MDESGLNVTEAKKKALRILERADRTRKELRDKLAAAGFEESAAEEAIAYVSSFGYLDDARYAENFIRRSVSHKSRARIMQELSARGVDRETASEAWETVTEDLPHDEQDMIRSLVDKKLQDPDPDPAALRRLYAWLARRGFSGEDIRHVLEERKREH